MRADTAMACAYVKEITGAQFCDVRNSKEHQIELAINKAAYSAADSAGQVLNKVLDRNSIFGGYMAVLDAHRAIHIFYHFDAKETRVILVDHN